ncbi:hypothetical protein [Acrocarpospora catenulata]|uniref:hypothetical protein n=1 Tax=Acrocarpospora catenulata TaxID=2836182 RepID=UPI001BDB4EA5|nr:hypothetical protein [Acrocarpospora catenulata]
MAERLVRTSYLDPTVNPPEPRQGDTGLHESRQDQEGYFGPLHRMHGSELHGWGVTSGLGVSATIGAAGLRVLPGVALDAQGRLLPLTPGGHAKLGDGTLAPVSEGGAALATAGVGTEAYVTIGWGETFDHTGVGAGVFNTETTPILRLVPTAGFAHEGAEIVLARVALDAAGRVTALDQGLRRVTAISVDRVEFRRPKAVRSGDAVTVAHEPSAELRALRDGGLVLEAQPLAVQPLGGGDSTLWVDPASGRVGIGTSNPKVPLDVNGGAVVRDRLRVGQTLGTVPLPDIDLDPHVFRPKVSGGAFVVHTEALGRVHAIDAGGFGFENPDGTSKTGNVPLLAQSDSTAIGILNGSGRQAFAINIDANAGTAAGRGVPTFYDKYDGNWHPAISLKNGNVGIGTYHPGTKLEVYSEEPNTAAVFATSIRNSGVYAHSAEGTGLVASGAIRAALFWGNVEVQGRLTKSDLQFKIDHPLDPERRYLSHSAVESDEMKNVYDGEVVLDENGAAEIVLPDWFEALNERIRYQLTPVGGPAPNLHVARKLSGNSFAIAGGEPGSEVCWQVTGVRHDPYALANPLFVETSKEGEEQGRYLHPEPHGKAADLALGMLAVGRELAFRTAQE